MPKTLILIPSRLAASRLPGKPLLKIDGLSIISHVFRKAQQSKIGDVYVCTGDKEIYEDVINNGGNCVLTNKEHNTGTDRIYEGFEKLNLFGIDYILNLQGDEPTIDVEEIKKLNSSACENKSDVATLACELNSKKKLNEENVVKVQTEKKLSLNNFSRAIKFFRKSNNLDFKNTYQHVGIYQYKSSILKKFVEFKQTKNETKYRLEQLRALDNQIKIDVVLANTVPVGVDTKKDYIEIKKLMEYKSS
tara:strand:- start:697 stop:1440 length:744 start_codon:yes stop_codon:yes gene_type:complete